MINKKWMIAIVACFFLAPLMAESMPQGKAEKVEKIQWRTNFEEAKKEAAESRKYLLLFFTGSDWCGYCKKMVNEIWSSPEVIKAMTPYFVFVEIDFPRRIKLPADLAEQNKALAAQFRIEGYPDVRITTAGGAQLAQLGYPEGISNEQKVAAFLKNIRSVLDNPHNCLIGQ